MVGAHTHDKLQFKCFKPNHLAPQGFSTTGNLEKMKEFILKFVNSETVKKEIGEVENFKKWLETFKLDSIT